MSNSPLPPLQLIPEPISRLIRLFEEHADVLQFPGTDAAALSATVAEMDAQRTAMDRAAAELDAARQQLAQSQQRLLDKARQAHAYASVYALGDEKMQEELAQIKMGAVQRTARKRKPMQRDNTPAKATDPEEEKEEEPSLGEEELPSRAAE